MLLTSPAVANCHTFLDLSPLSLTYFMDGPLQVVGLSTKNERTNGSAIEQRGAQCTAAYARGKMAARLAQALGV